jgi:hypothetical protein
MCPLSVRLTYLFSRSEMGRTHEQLKKEKEKSLVFAYLITVKENGKKWGLRRTNEWSLYSFSPLPCGVEEEKSWWTNWTHCSCYFSFVVWNSVSYHFLFINFLQETKNRKKEKKIYSFVKKKISPDDHLCAYKTKRRNMNRIEEEKRLCSLRWFDNEDEVN